MIQGRSAILFGGSGERFLPPQQLRSAVASMLAAVASLKAQVTAQEVKVGAMRGYLAESAPDFKQAMTELADLRAQLASGFALLLFVFVFVFVRQALRNGARDEETAGKLAQLKTTWRRAPGAGQGLSGVGQKLNESDIGV